MKSRTLLLCATILSFSSHAIAATYSLRTLASFDYTNGGIPSGELTLDAEGNLYGVTLQGGPNLYGTIFKVAAHTNELTTLVSFDGSNGGSPVGSLLADQMGNLYGVTSSYGAGNKGNVYKISADTHELSTLASFNGSNGSNPHAGLVADANGNLYGTTNNGGAFNAGTIFKIAANTSTLTTLYSFKSGEAGNRPLSGLAIDANGNLYGTTFRGGEFRYGTAFRFSLETNQYSTLVNFDRIDGYQIGYTTEASLIVDSNNNIFGTRSAGGAYEYGTIFKIDTSNNTLTTLYDFRSGDQPYQSISKLLLSAEGKLYGTTRSGGTNFSGTAFEFSLDNQSLTTLVSFSEQLGRDPHSGLIADNLGNFYGTTYLGGPGGYGTVFKLAVVPEASSLLLAAFGLVAFAYPTIKRFYRPAIKE